MQQVAQVFSIRLPLSLQEEREEGGACGGGMVKMEEAAGEELFSPSHLHGGGKDGDGGKELLRHLLKDKFSPATTPSPTAQAPPTAHHQLSNESVRSKEEDRPGCHGNMVRRGSNNFLSRHMELLQQADVRSHDLLCKAACVNQSGRFTQQ